jgi:metallophosphoesterase superfamily enzyme
MRDLAVLFEDSAVLLNCKSRGLAVSDIHIGYEIELVKKGISLPQRTSALADRLVEIGKRHRARSLFILGDVKHKIAWASSFDFFQVTTFFNRLNEWFKHVVVTLGNHDGGIRNLLPDNVEVVTSRGTYVKCKESTFTLLHGNAWPRPESLQTSYIITGHGHYMIELRDSIGLRLFEPVWLIGEIDRLRYAEACSNNKQGLRIPKGNIKLIVLPAFNSIVGGIPVNKAVKRHSNPIMRYLIEEKTKLYLMDGTYLTTLSRIKEPE